MRGQRRKTTRKIEYVIHMFVNMCAQDNMSELFHSLLKKCEHIIARKRILPSVSFEYEPYIQTNRIHELVSHPEFPTVRNHALCYAAAHGDVGAVKLLLQAGADFSTGDALESSARSGNMSVVRFLVETAGFRVNQHHILATLENDNVEIEQYLLEKYQNFMMTA